MTYDIPDGAILGALTYSTVTPTLRYFVPHNSVPILQQAHILSDGTIEWREIPYVRDNSYDEG